MTYALFCTVIDNYGDAGACMRLAREMALEGETVTLYCDDLKTLKAIALPEDLTGQLLKIAPWPHSAADYTPATTVILAFSCRPGADILGRIEETAQLILSLEYLSAESFVDDFHGLSSPLFKCPCYFFFPGFSEKSGGLNFEESFKERLLSMSAPVFPAPDETLKVTLFSYRNPALEGILHLLDARKGESDLTVFEGLPLTNLNEILGTALRPGERYQSGNLQVRVQAMVPQNAYDGFLLGAHLNLVRGEDSIVRALLTGRMFLWHIYPQEENAHLVKLEAFMERMRHELRSREEQDAFEDYRALMLAYNGEGSFPASALDSLGPVMTAVTARFARRLLERGTLASYIRAFVREKCGFQLNSRT